MAGNKNKTGVLRISLKKQELAKRPEVLRCTCPHTLCEWHGRCRECVALHRYYRDHVPACLQLFINEKLKEIVKIGELMAVEKEPTSVEYRLYVREQDEKQSRKSD